VSGLLEVVDAVVAAVPVATGFARDTTGAEPSPFQPDTLHGWPGVDRFTAIDTGGTDQGDFTFSLAYCVAAEEGPGLERGREVSEHLDEAVGAIRSWVAGHRAVAGLWEWLGVTSATYDAIRGHDYRGVRIDLAGYRQMED
jgi:hypothetical protein